MATTNQSAAAKRLAASMGTNAPAPAAMPAAIANFQQAFGAGFAPAMPAQNTRADLPKALYWLNVGYDSGIAQEDGTTRFISLPQGIALDTTEPLNTKSSNADYSMFQQARNALLDQLIQKADTLQPGESCIVNLQLQLRRIADEPEEIASVDNPYIQQIQI